MPSKTKAATAPMRSRKSPAITSAQSITDLAPNDRNPRKPWSEEQRKSFQESLALFGDLSGIVFNETTGRLVGGHKRVDEFKNDKKATLVIAERLPVPDPCGTTSYGHVTLTNGARFAYRAVQWDAGKEAAANLAANQWGAEWDWEGVSDFLKEAQEAGFDFSIAGFSDFEISALFQDEAATMNTSTQSTKTTAEKKIVSTYEVIAECRDEADQQKVFALLSKHNIKCRVCTL
jgi:hypothetical protein